MRVLDNIMALRVAYLLVTPIEQTDAFKLGLIDDTGRTIRKAKTSDESNATSMLHRMCWNLKRLISLVPGGSTRIGSLIAAYALMKEAYEKEIPENELADHFVTRYNALFETDTAELDALLDKLSELSEDVPVNSTAGVAVKDNPLSGDKIVRRKKFKTIELPKE